MAALLLPLLLAGLVLPLVGSMEARERALLASGGAVRLRDLPRLRPEGPLRAVEALFRGLLFARDGGGERASLIRIGAAALGLAVIPFGSTYETWGWRWSLVVADLDHGLLYALALGALASAAGLLASGNSAAGSAEATRAAVGALSRAMALGASALGVFIALGGVRFGYLVAEQQHTLRVLDLPAQLGWVAPGSPWIEALTLPTWGIVVQPAAFCLFGAALLAGGSVASGPPSSFEADATERLADALELALGSALMVILFLGGASLPWVSDAALLAALSSVAGPAAASLLAAGIHLVVFIAKLGALALAQILLRWRLRRLAHEQTLRLLWRTLVPLALLNALLTAIAAQLAGEL